MNKLIIIVLFGGVMFCGSAAGSWYVQSLMQGNANASQGEIPADQSENQRIVAAPSLAETTLKPQDQLPITKAELEQRLPTALRPRDLSVEELLRLSMNVKEREERVKLTEDLLQKRNVHQQLALTDLEGERREIDGLRLQVQEQLQYAEALVEKLNDGRTKILEEKENANQSLQKMKHEQIAISTEHLDNTKRLSMWIQSMDPAKAAEVLTAMANDGTEQMEIAVQILRNLEEREAAKILSAIDDTRLVQQLIEKFRKLQKPPSQKKPR